MARTVTVIPQTIQPLTGLTVHTAVRKKVAAYARVSTDSEEQQTSYEAQVDYYTRHIKAKAEWEFIKVYTDATDIIGLKQNPTNGRRFSPIFVLSGHFSA